MMYTKAQLEGMKMKELVDVAWELDVKINPKGSKAKAVVQIWAAQREIEDHVAKAKDEEIITPEEPKTPANISVTDKPNKTTTGPKKANLKLSELTYKGETKSIRAWADELKMPWPTLYDRVNRNGWSIEDAIETPLGQRRPK